MEEKLTKVKSLLKELDSVLVAYSGGVDSTLLAALAVETLGQSTLAVTAASPLYPAPEITQARSLAQELGIRHMVIQTDELDDPSFVVNDRHRCYYCKRGLFRLLSHIATENGLEWVVDGTNRDDLEDFRPGMIAAQEFGVRSPLMEAGLTKAEIRALCQSLGLPNWDKPPTPCLASRIPYGTPITTELLERILSAEEALAKLGLRHFRVRHHGNIARIEASPQDMALLGDVETSLKVVAELRALGYIYVTLDLAGYRTGSMNESLKEAR